MGVHWKDWCWSWNSNTLATWGEELTHLKRPWCWERLRTGEGDDRGWDGWMASPTQWRWVWVNSRSWWWTGRPGVLLFMGLQRVRLYWVTEPYMKYLTYVCAHTCTYRHTYRGFSGERFYSLCQGNPWYDLGLCVRRTLQYILSWYRHDIVELLCYLWKKRFFSCGDV